MKAVFGPVSSRRFGLSLGLDLSPALKQCNFDCVYCELKPKKAMAKQLESIAVSELVNELKQRLKTGVEFDFITLTANGEPSLYPHLQELISELNKLKKDKRLLILSNGTAVLDEAKFQALLELDVVKFSLDSACESSFFRIDKALKDIDLKKMISKMAEFSQQFKGELVMEVLVVKGINDNELEFRALNEAFAKIKPARIDISTIDRPPAYPVKGVSEACLNELSAFITAAPCVLPLRTYEKKNFDFSEEELLKMLSLRPQSEFDVRAKFSLKTQIILEKLLKKKQIYIQNLAGVCFYRA